MQSFSYGENKVTAQRFLLFAEVPHLTVSHPFFGNHSPKILIHYFLFVFTLKHEYVPYNVCPSIHLLLRELWIFLRTNNQAFYTIKAV